MAIYSGGSIVNSALYLYKDDIAYDMVISSGGGMYVSRGGTATETTVNSSGAMMVFSGGTATETIVNNGGAMYVSSGGSMIGAVAKSSGTLDIGSGAAVENAVIQRGGYMTLWANASALNTVIMSGGALILNAATSFYSDMTLSSGSLTLFDGDSAARIAVTSSGWMRISSGGTASDTTLVHYGSQTVYAGGSAIATNVSSGGYMTVSSGGSAIETEVSNGGSMAVYGGGFVFGATVYDNGTLYVSGGFASGATAYSSGRLQVYSGGVLLDAQVEQTGRAYISSGATVSRLLVASDGYVQIAGGGSAVDLTIESGGRFHFGIASDTALSYVSGGSAGSVGNSLSGTTVSSGQGFTISKGGSAENVTVAAGGSLTVASGGRVTGIMQESGGNVSFDYNADSNSVIEGRNAKGEFCLRNGVADNFILYEGGAMHISSFAGVDFHVTNTDVLGGAMYIMTSGHVGNTLIDSSGIQQIGVGQALVYGDSTEIDVDHTLIRNGGRQSISLGDYYDNGYGRIVDTLNVTDTVIDDGGQQLLFFDGMSYSYPSGSKTFTINIDRTVVNSGGEQYIVINNYTYSAPPDSYKYYFNVSGTVVNDGGVFKVYDFSYVPAATVSVSDLTIADGGEAILRSHNGSIFLSGVISVAGNLSISGTVNADNAEIIFDLRERDASGDILASGLANVAGGNYSIMVAGGQGGGLYWLSDELADFGSVTLKTKNGDIGTLQLNSGSLHYDGQYYVLRLHDGSLLLHVTENDNAVTIYRGDVLSSSASMVFDAELQAGDTMVVAGGGIACNTTVAYGGSVRLLAGGVLSGTTTLGGEMTVEGVASGDNGSLALDLRNRSAADNFMISGGDHLSGFSLSIVVPEIALNCDYRLAQGMARQDVSFVVGDGRESYGTLSLEQTVLVHGTFAYTLVQDGDRIYLSAAYTPATVVTADITAATNQNITLTATYDASAAGKQYSLDGGANWLVYDGGVTVTDNGTVLFRSVDAAGNEATAHYTVSNIDKEAPTITGIAADTATATNRDVTVTANFADNVALATKQYKIGTGSWQNYTSGVTMTVNGAVHFKAVDSAGNEAIEQYTVSNIDKTAPTITQIKANTTASTYQNVTVTAVFADDVALASKQYKAGDGAWKNYTSGVTMTANGTVYFKAIDTAGNEAEAKYVVSNIDKVAPTITQITASTKSPTNRDVTVTAIFADDVALASKQYRIDSGAWLYYVDGVTMTANGTVYFKAIDTAGNVANKQYTVANIDKVAPTITGIAASKTAPTNQNVTVTANFADNVALASKQYKLGSGSWQSYTGAVTVTANTTVYFKAVDTAGNEANTQYAVSNIDKIAPTITNFKASATAPTNRDVTVTVVFADNVALASKQYKIGNGSWQNYTDGVTMTANNTIYFKAVDTAGNETNAQYAVAYIDKVAPDAPVLSVSQRDRLNGTVTVTAEFASDVVKREYSLDGVNWLSYTKAVAVASNTTIRVRGYDEAGNVSGAEYQITNIVPLDANGPGAVTLTPKVSRYNVTITWRKPVTQDKVKITGYEVEYNGETSIVKGTSYSLKNVAVSTGNTIQVRAIDSLGRYGALSPVVSFDVRDVTAPKLGKVTAAISGYTGMVSWSGTDNVGIVKYVVACGDKTQTVTDTSAKFTDLAVGKYKATVQAFDAAGNASKVGKVSITVKDATPPEKVTGLVIPLADAKYNALLSWAPGVDNSGKIARYEIMLDNGKILKSSKTSLKVSKLSVGTHTYQVRAIDPTKNAGEWSDVQTFTVKDMTAPVTVSVKAKVEGNSLSLTWKTPKDNVGVTGYILKHGVNLEKTETLKASQLSFRIDNIAKGSYQYQIVAVDAAGNQSKAKSGKATIKTELATVMSLELSEAIPSLAFDAGVSTGSSGLHYDDPLAFCSALQTESDLRLTAADLFASDNEKKSSSLLAAAF